MIISCRGLWWWKVLINCDSWQHTRAKNERLAFRQSHVPQPKFTTIRASITAQQSASFFPERQTVFCTPAQIVRSLLVQDPDIKRSHVRPKDGATGRPTHLSYVCSVSLHQVVCGVCRSNWEENVFIQLLKESEGGAAATRSSVVFSCTSASCTEGASRLMLWISLVVMLSALRSRHVGVGGNTLRNSEYHLSSVTHQQLIGSNSLTPRW